MKSVMHLGCLAVVFMDLSWSNMLLPTSARFDYGVTNSGTILHSIVWSPTILPRYFLFRQTFVIFTENLQSPGINLEDSKDDAKANRSKITD